MGHRVKEKLNLIIIIKRPGKSVYHNYGLFHSQCKVISYNVKTKLQINVDKLSLLRDSLQRTHLSSE